MRQSTRTRPRLSYGGNRGFLTLLAAYQAMARTGAERGVEFAWSHLSMPAGVGVGPAALSVGIIAQPHDFQ